MKNKLLLWGSSVMAVGLALLGTVVASAADIATTSEVTTAFSGTLSSVVYAIVNVIVSFFQNNLPVIVILGVCIGLVFMFIAMATRAKHGR